MIYHAPKKLNDLSSVKAGLTYAKRERFNTSESIHGLNFGDNTSASIQVIEHNLGVLNDELDHNGKIALAEQVHGADVLVVNSPGYYPGVDGLVTSAAELLIAVKVADCAAILISDTKAGVIAAVHAGWRGAASGILHNAIRKMEGQGAAPKQMKCYISPCLSMKNFEIGEEVALRFPTTFINRNIGKKPHLNLKAFLEQELINAGVRKNSIDIDSRCTIDDISFYSFRRERDKAGRMLAFITQTDN